MTDKVDIIYTTVDEAPELASGSFLPIIRAFAGPAAYFAFITEWRNSGDFEGLELRSGTG